MVGTNYVTYLSEFESEVISGERKTSEYFYLVKLKIKEAITHLKKISHIKTVNINLGGNDFIEKNKIIETIDILEGVDINNFLDIKLISVKVPAVLELNIRCIRELCYLSDMAVRISAQA